MKILLVILVTKSEIGMSQIRECLSATIVLTHWRPQNEAAAQEQAIDRQSVILDVKPADS